jgi:hypothetical protein
MSDYHAPRKAELLLEALGADTEFRDDVIGDLAEEYALRVSWDGVKVARRWYYREALRATPYLLRDWWRRLSLKDARYFANVTLWASVCIVASDVIILGMMQGVALGKLQMRAVEGAPIASIVYPSLLLVWTVCDGAVGGFVAAHLGRRAPLPSVLSLAVVGGGLIFLTLYPASLWYRAANVVALMAGILAGGVLRASLRESAPAEGH